MDLRALRSDAILLLTAAIWGFAFAAQRAGMEHIGPFLYTGIRFLLGAVVLLPLWAAGRRSREPGYAGHGTARWSAQIRAASVAAGLLLFLGVTFQQVGLKYTTAGKAGFITGLYVILVPVLGMVRRQSSGRGTWIGAVAAVVGLYLLSVRGRFAVDKGDLLVLVCAFFWAFHVHMIAWLSPRVSAIRLAVVQYLVCAALSLVLAAMFEPIDPSAIVRAAIPISYGGIFSVGIAYTLQVVGQKHAPPAHASIIMSLEGVFAVLGGYLVLSETLSGRGVAGCALMLVGMLVSQVSVVRSRTVRTQETADADDVRSPAPPE